jgi:hypothetical protein
MDGIWAPLYCFAKVKGTDKPQPYVCRHAEKQRSELDAVPMNLPDVLGCRRPTDRLTGNGVLRERVGNVRTPILESHVLGSGANRFARHFLKDTPENFTDVAGDWYLGN